jgi:SAM-dependent methyltransferase
MPKSDAEGLYQVPEFYEAFLGANGADLPHYKGLAVRLGGPVLDLACGTGRVSLALAAEGLAVCGLDASAPMLDRARQRAAGAGLSATWVQAELGAFQLGQRFPLAILPYNGLQHLHSAAELAAFFARLRGHLRPGGHFAFDVHLPQPALLARDPDEWFGVEGGPSFQGWNVAAERSAYDPLAQVLTQTWRLAGPQGASRDLSLALRQFFPQELQALLAAQGFSVLQAWGGFQGQALGPTSLRQDYLCRLS